MFNIICITLSVVMIGIGIYYFYVAFKEKTILSIGGIAYFIGAFLVYYFNNPLPVIGSYFVALFFNKEKDELVSYNDDQIFPWAIKKFNKFGQELQKRKIISKYEIIEKDGIRLNLYRKSDNKQVSVEIYNGGEVLSRVFDHSYVWLTSEYDKKYKKEVLVDMLDSADGLMKVKNYYEEIWEKNNKIAYKRIIFPNGVIENASMIYGGWFRRNFGYKKRIVQTNI